MSYQATDKVQSRSKAKGATRLVLLALAGHADKNGMNARPGNATLAAKANVSERTVERALDKLEEMGEIECTGRQGQHGKTAYRIRVGFEDSRTDNCDILEPTTCRVESDSRTDNCDTSNRHLRHVEPTTATIPPHPPNMENSPRTIHEPSYSVNPESSETPKPKKKPKPDPLQDIPELDAAMEELTALVIARHPQAKPHPKPTDRNARDTLAKLVRLDEYPAAQVIEILRWLFTSNHEAALFWQQQVQSLAALRNKTKGGPTKFAAVASRWDSAKSNRNGNGHKYGGPQRFQEIGGWKDEELEF